MAASSRRFRIPVTVLIVALILALAAPSLGFSALLLLQSDSINERQMTSRATQGVQVIGDRLDHEFRSLTTNLALLASSGWIESEEYDRLHARATQALAGTDTYLLAFDSDINQVLNTRVPYGTPLPTAGDPETVRRAIQSGDMVVSNVYLGRVARQPVFSVTLPIISNEARVKALMLTRNASTLEGTFKDDLPPPGWRYAIFDSADVFVAGDAPNVDTALITQLCSGDHAGLNQITRNKLRYSAASEKVLPWGWRACVWTSSDQAGAQLSQRWRAFMIIVLVVVGVTVLAGGALGRMLGGAISRAATVGRALDSDGDVPERHSIVREVDEVLGSLTRQARRRKAYEEELKLLQRETSHRAKNQLQIGAALVRLSARSATSIEQLRDDVSARLSALGRSLETMSQGPTGEVAMAPFIIAQLAPFASDQPDRLKVVGENAFITPATAQSLGLTLHELATNAAKYGAWSAPEGRVTIEWSKVDDGLRIVWSEAGGPAPNPSPTRAGFGSSLIEAMIDRNLGGSVVRDYPPSGLVCTITLPTAARGML